MKCLKCGVENENGAKFCVNCGSPLEDGTINDSNIELNLTNNQMNNVQQNVNNMSNINNSNMTNNNFNISNNSVVKSIAAFPFVQYCINLLLKPYDTFKKNEENLNNSKNSIILTVIVTLLATIATLISTIISSIRVPSYTISKGYTYKWDFGQLKNVQFANIVFKNIIMFALIIGAIALVFYLGSMVIKKNTNFFKLLGISAGSMIPYILGSILLSTIFSIIWAPLGTAIETISIIYTLIILYELINLELNLPIEQKIYFNLICFSILLVGGNFIYDRFITTSVTKSIDDILNSYR